MRKELAELFSEAEDGKLIAGLVAGLGREPTVVEADELRGWAGRTRIAQGCLDGLLQGSMECVSVTGDEPEFRLSPQGTAEVERLIRGE